MTSADRILTLVQKIINAHEEHSTAIIRRFGEDGGNKITTQMLLDQLEEQRQSTVARIKEIMSVYENT